MPEPIVLTFGGGLNARRRTADVSPQECVPPSENFDLDPQYLALRGRKAFDLMGTAPNGGSIDGFAQLIKQDGSVSTLVQAGTTVYSWDGADTFTSVATIAAGAKLRGPREHNVTLDEYVIVTDLNKAAVVKKWDGTTFADLAHNLGGSFYAKYCRIHNERAFFGNITTTTATPHIFLGSAIGDAEQLSNANRPTSSLGADSAFFLAAPDLRPINSLEAAFGQFLISTDRGRLYRLAGSSAFDFEVQEFHTGSAVSGDEAMKNIGNDVVMGLTGRIETLTGTLNFGDVESNDLSLPIGSLIDNVSSWVIEYDRRMQRVFCFPNNQAAVYVMHKSVLNLPIEAGISPWSKWVTLHTTGMQPTAVMQLINPLDGRDMVYFGDANGGVYRFDGSGGTDGGTSNITVKRRSGLIAVPEGNIYDVRGWIHYRKLFATTVTIRILGGGVAIYDQAIDLKLPTVIGSGSKLGIYGGDSYYGDNVTIYGVDFSERISRQDWAAAGHSSHIQIEIEISGATDFDLQEVGFTFSSSET